MALYVTDICVTVYYVTAYCVILKKLIQLCRLACTALSMPPSSISTAIHVLIEKDYVEQNNERNYSVINPLLLAVLQGASD
jgi:hypothetical protein